MKRVGTSAITNNGKANATSAVREPLPTEESLGLPAPPPQLKPNSPHRSGKTTRTGPVPPAPPSGDSVSQEGAGASVVWPTGRGEEDEVAAALDSSDCSRLEELD